MAVVLLSKLPILPQLLLTAHAHLTTMGGTLSSLTIPNHPPVPENARLALLVLKALVQPCTSSILSKMFAIAWLTFMVKPELLLALNALELTPTLPLAQLLPLVPWVLKYRLAQLGVTLVLQLRLLV
jgi:hypothetical protein